MRQYDKNQLEFVWEPVPGKSFYVTEAFAQAYADTINYYAFIYTYLLDGLGDENGYRPFVEFAYKGGHDLDNPAIKITAEDPAQVYAQYLDEAIDHSIVIDLV